MSVALEFVYLTILLVLSLDHKLFSPGTWFETQGSLGVEIYVAKNATSYYISWWKCPRMSDFNFTTDIVIPGQICVYFVGGFCAWSVIVGCGDCVIGL